MFAYFISVFTFYILLDTPAFESNMKNIGYIANRICSLKFWDAYIVPAETEILMTDTYLYSNFINLYDDVFATPFGTLIRWANKAKSLLAVFIR